MKYIYDILLNFKDEYYDFYDWNKNDSIIHIRKIPIIKISSNDLYNIKNNKIKLDISFLENIEYKTEMFTNKGIKKIKNSCLLSDGESVIGINIINKKYKVSSLLVDEELDTLEDIVNLDTCNIKYIILKECDRNEFKTRKQIEKEVFIKREISKISNDSKKLEYLYYECFDKKENNIDNIILNLTNFKEEKITNKLYDFFKLIEVHK